MDPAKPKLVKILRALLAVLSPLAVTDIAADFHPEVFATDSSKEKGATVSAPITPVKAKMLHRACQSKGSYTRLVTALLKMAGSARVTAAVAARGVAVGPPVDLSRSSENDVSSNLVMRWLSHLI